MQLGLCPFDLFLFLFTYFFCQLSSLIAEAVGEFLPSRSFPSRFNIWKQQCSTALCTSQEFGFYNWATLKQKQKPVLSLYPVHSVQFCRSCSSAFMFKKQHKWNESLSVLREHDVKNLSLFLLFIFFNLSMLTWPRKLLSGAVCPVSGSNNHRFVTKNPTLSVKIPDYITHNATKPQPDHSDIRMSL